MCDWMMHIQWPAGAFEIHDAVRWSIANIKRNQQKNKTSHKHLNVWQGQLLSVIAERKKKKKI